MRANTLNRIRLAGAFMTAVVAAGYLSGGAEYFKAAKDHEESKACDRGFLDVAVQNHLPSTNADVGYNPSTGRCTLTYTDGTAPPRTWMPGTTTLDPQQ